MHSLGRQMWTTITRDNALGITDFDGFDVGCMCIEITFIDYTDP